MAKTYRKKWLLLLPLSALIFIAIKFNIFNMAATQLALQARDCSNPLFTVPPVDFADIESITPLGNLNPPDHTIPTGHVYLNLPAGADIDTNDTLPPPARKLTNVLAPGDVIVTDIERVEYLGKSGEVQRADFSVSFAACRSVSGYFHHLSAISIELKGNGSCERYAINSAGAKSVKRCRFLVGREIKAGTVIGQAGKQFSSFDIGLKDDRVPALGFANSKRLGGSVKTVCPFDYYANDTKQKFAAYFGMGAKKRTVPPVCGEIMQDKIGTAQGIWFTGNAKDGPEGWSKEIALVHDNIDPTLGVISAGGLNGQAFRLQFVPTGNGFKNREFSEIKPGKSIYCYPSVAMGYGIERGKEVLIELTDNTRLKAELKSGNCKEPYTFDNPIIYER